MRVVHGGIQNRGGVSMQDLDDLAGLIPLDRLQEATRERLEQAFRASGDAASCRDAARQAVLELLHSGELLKVDLSSRIGTRRCLHMVRGTNRLVDLGDLLPRRYEPEARAAVPPEDATPPAEVESREDRTGNASAGGPGASRDEPASEHVFGMLEAMERAQDLQVGDPRSREAGVVVDRILALLQRSIGQVAIHAQLHGLEAVPEDARRLIAASQQQGDMFWQRCRDPGQAAWIPELRQLPEPLRANVAVSLAPEAVTAAVPILAPGDPTLEIGVLYVSGRPDWSKDRLLPLAQRLACFVTNRWRTQHDVNRRVHTDSLTGLHNRAYFDLHFSLELERARRAGMPLTLVLSDLDRFKTVNDTYGHPFGDQVLCAVAHGLQAALRRIDHVCRIGGEEFACLLPSTTIDEAREVLSRLVARPFLVDLPSGVAAGSLPVTLSYGAVCYPDAGTGTDELQRKADSMLYQAKRLGRNRCCLWMPDGRHLLLAPPTVPTSPD